MGNIYISLDEEHEKILRSMAQQKYSGKKGSISKVISEALDDLYHEQKHNDRRNEAIARLMKLSEKGLKLGVKKGKKIYEKREELYAGRV